MPTNACTVVQASLIFEGTMVLINHFGVIIMPVFCLPVQSSREGLVLATAQQRTLELPTVVESNALQCAL